MKRIAYLASCWTLGIILGVALLGNLVAAYAKHGIAPLIVALVLAASIAGVFFLGDD